jgi:hypothetical protein
MADEARAASAGRTKETDGGPIDDGEVVVDEPGEPRAAAG